MTLTNAQEPEFEFEEPRPLIPGRGRRILVIVMGMIVAGVVLSIIALTLTRGSWWYTYGTDQALDHETRARVEEIRDEVDASGAFPEVVAWLNGALDPDAHPTDIRTCLLTAQVTLEAADDPRWAEALGELRAIIQMIRPAPPWETTTPYPVSTLEWPW